jgi:hypothetical protein
MTISVKELSCPSFSTGEKKGNDSLEEELVLGTQMPILNPQLATDPGPASAAASPVCRTQRR